MRISASWQQKKIAGCLVLFMGLPFAEAAAAQPRPAAQQTASAPAANSQDANSTATHPDATASQPAAVSGDTGSSSPSAGESSSDPLPPAPQQQQNGNSNPVGTAAAPYEKTTGIAASRPAGAVVAPAKQKRSRSFLIRIGLVVGACVAVGTVVALSAGSPSRP